jgi:hypothetical protein
MELSALPCTKYYLSHMPADHDLLKAVHALAFGGKQGDARSRKARLGAFAGGGKDAAALAAEMEDNQAWALPCLRDLCAFLDLDGSGDARALIGRASAFLAQPRVTARTVCNEDGVPVHLAKKQKKLKKSAEKKKKKSSSSSSSSSSRSSKKRSRSSSSISASAAASSPTKKAKKAPTPVNSVRKPTKPKSAKFLYIQDRKDAAKAANPGMDSTALAMQLISEYKNLPDEEKQKYKARAAAEKQAFEEAQALLAEMEEMGDMGL